MLEKCRERQGTFRAVDLLVALEHRSRRRPEGAEVQKRHIWIEQEFLAQGVPSDTVRTVVVHV